MKDRPKILLADDSVTMRKVAELAFVDAGLDVSTAVDGQTAMEAFVREQPDMVLVDIGLAGTSGYQICEMIKHDDATKHIPVLLLVGAFEPFDQAEAERVGADGFLMKPFNPIREVITKIRELLDDEGLNETFAFGISEAVSGEVDDIEELYSSSYVETTRVEEVFIGDIIPPDDAVSDDELIEKEMPVPAAANPFERVVDDEIFDESPAEEEERPEFLETIEFSETLEPRPKTAEKPQEIQDPASIISEGNIRPSDDAAKDMAKVEVPASPQPEISDEIIDKIVERVLAKLNDAVVREVAREEVPRVAEKLMREALEQEVKG
jgi:CheY-like chemotaxis protein